MTHVPSKSAEAEVLRKNLLPVLGISAHLGGSVLVFIL